MKKNIFLGLIVALGFAFSANAQRTLSHSVSQVPDMGSIACAADGGK